MIADAGTLVDTVRQLSPVHGRMPVPVEELLCRLRERRAELVNAVVAATGFHSDHVQLLWNDTEEFVSRTPQLLSAWDPAQLVVAVVVGPQFLTIPFTVPLDAPLILDEAEGVH